MGNNKIQSSKSAGSTQFQELDHIDKPGPGCNKKIGRFLAAGILVTSHVAVAESQQLEEVVVTAQKRAENVQDIPLSITSFSEESMRENGITVARDLANVTPNFQWKGDTGLLGNTIFLRGIGSNTVGPEAVSAVGIYVDEVYIGNSWAANFFNFDLERSEVLRGPQGTLYGRNSTGGAVNFYSRKPEAGGGVNGYIDVGVGQYEQRDFEAAVGFPILDSLAARISVQTKDGQEFKENITTNTDSSVDSEAVRTQLAWQASDTFEVLGSFFYSDADVAIQPFKQIGLLDPSMPVNPDFTLNRCPQTPRLGSGCSDLFGFVGDDDFDKAASDLDGTEGAENRGGMLKADWQLPSFTITSITSYIDYESTRVQDIDGTPIDQLTTTALNTSEQLSQEIRFTSDTAGPFQWVAGLYYFEEDLDLGGVVTARGFGPGALSGVGTTTEGVLLDYTQTTTTKAVFGQGDYAISDDLSLTLGLRWTEEEKEFQHNSYLIDLDGSALVVNPTGPHTIVAPLISNRQGKTWREPSWRVALDYHLDSDVLLYASVSSNWKAGVGNSQASFDPLESQLVEPEFLTAYEVGFKSSWLGRTVQLNGAAFFYDFEDMQVSIFATNNSATPVQINSNAGQATIYGAELELAAMPTDNWFVSLGLGLLDTEYDEFNAGGAFGDLAGNELPAAPAVNANGLIRYTAQLESGSLSFQTDFSYRDDQFFAATNDPILSEEGYWLANLRIAYKFHDAAIELALWGRNIFDEEYLVDAFDVSGFGYDLATVGTQRTFGINARYSF